MLRTIAFKIVLSLWFILWTPILLVSLITPKMCHYLVTKCAKGVLGVARIIGNVKYKIHYPKTNLPACKIIASKHMSILEVAILETHIPNAFFIIKQELMWIPIYGWAFARMGLVPVNRKSGSTNMRKLSDAVNKRIKSGMTLIIFPEGTRAKPNHPIKIKRGLLFLAEHLHLPIVPVGTDSGLYWPKKGYIKPGTAQIFIEKPLPFDANLDDIEKAINRHSA